MKIPYSLRRFISGNWRLKAHRVVRDVIAMFSALRNPRVPWKAKALTLASVAYLLMPLDLIPDAIPIIGMADDLAFIPLACHFASKMVSPAVMEGLRDNADVALMRWGPKLKVGLAVFLVAWIALAGIGGCLMFRGSGGGVEQRGGGIDWERKLVRELTAPKG